MKRYIVITGVIALIVLSLITLNVFFQRSLQRETAEQFNRQQLLLASAEASNIQSYFAGIKEEILHISQVLSLFPVHKEADFTILTNTFFKDPGNISKRVEIIDREGRLLFSRGDLPEGADTRSLAIYAKKYCPGEVLLTRQETRRAYIVAPVCREGSSVDAVIISVDIQDMARAFLGPIKSGSRGYAWMMDGKGDLLYHPTQPDMVGRNLYRTDSSCFKCHRTFDVEKKIIEGRGDYYGRYVAPTGEDKVLAFSTASFGDSRWIVAVSAPYSEVTMSIKKSMKLYSWILILIVAAAGFFSATLIVSYRKREKAEERVKHQKELEKYAAELEQKVAARTRELSTEKEKLNTVVSAMGCGILLLDTRGKIQWINETMKEIAGRDITGIFCEEICTDCSVIGSYAENNMQTEILSNLFGRSDRFFQVTTAPVKGEEGVPQGYIRLVQDVTGMKRMEEQMMHSEKLASLERLTSGIAQEIGNPLTSVFSFVEVLEEMEQDEFKRETLDTIYFHMNRIADILKQLSGFSKMPSMELKPCRINGIIEESLSLIQYDRRAQDITIVRDLQPDIPEIITDASQISQVIVNILLNAADAMPDSGTLTIQSREKDGGVVISFEDTGPGIGREDLGRIFEPFYTTKETATGMGLAVSYRIIRKLNGTLTAESEVGKGSRFLITLPANGDLTDSGSRLS